MRLKVNGELFEAISAETIFQLLRELNIESARVGAVEVNLAIVRKTDFSTYKLKDGDEIEIVNFVGGG
jgi:sulfur carrier protein